MYQSPHTFSIPVMGTGHSIDSPIRVAHFGINSVISIVDDLLVERIRKHYCKLYNLEFKSIARNAFDGRAKRITAYLETVKEIVDIKFNEVKKQVFFQKNDKAKYFEMLPDNNPLKTAYLKLLSMDEGSQRTQLENELTQQMAPGSIDVNIMAKVDLLNKDKDGNEQDPIYSDANASLRGFGNSSLSSALVLSAGFNPRLFNYMTEFKDFYRDKWGNLKKKIILKVSDFRSALIQGKYLARNGIEVSEYRIESGLNCGGHAFPANGLLLPTLLKEFNEKRDLLLESVKSSIIKHYNSIGEIFEESWFRHPKITVQGGIGTFGETERLRTDYNMEGTGWGTPFLLVPEATSVDKETRTLLANAGLDDVFVSHISPLGVPFNTVRSTGSEKWHKQRIEKGKPGSPCPKGFLKSNTEFTEEPICLASTEYQLLKIDSIKHDDTITEYKKETMIEKVLEKECLCDHLGNGALIDLDIVKETRGRQAICPGPNIVWFKRDYTLKEMVDHIYGRGESLVNPQRPHMFAKEMAMYVDYLQDMVAETAHPEKEAKKFKSYVTNLEMGIDYCLEISKRKPFKNENLESLAAAATEQQMRLECIKDDLNIVF